MEYLAVPKFGDFGGVIFHIFAQMLYVTYKLHENICQRVLPAG